MKDLWDWYRYLEGIYRDTSSLNPLRSSVRHSTARRSTDPADSAQLWAPTCVLRRTRWSRRTYPEGFRPRQEHLRTELDVTAVSTGISGHRPLTDAQEEMVQRLLERELALHGAGAAPSLNEGILRSPDLRTLSCRSAATGERQFKRSAVRPLPGQRFAMLEAIR